MAILPKAAEQYDRHIGGYSPDNCYYALTLLASGAVPQGSEASLTGTWVISTRTRRAMQVARLGDYAYLFSRWESNGAVELHSDNQDTIAIYDVNKNDIVNRQVVEIILRFKITSDKVVTIDSLNSPASEGCTGMKQTSDGFLNYPVSCIQNGVEVSVPQYKRFQIKYLAPLTLEINGNTYRLSDQSYREIDL